MLMLVRIMVNPCTWAVILIQAWNLVLGLIGWINTAKINAKPNLIDLSLAQVYE
jgi:hypothetical protein